MAYAHSSLGDVVVWEWMNDFGAWVAYQPEASNYIEVGSSQHQNRIKLGDADSNLSSLVVELQKFCQISSNGIERPIRRMTYNCDSAPAHGVQWQWEGDRRRQWHSYSMEVANVLEEAFSRNSSTIVNLNASPTFQPHDVNLHTMKQINQNTGFIRNVQRKNMGQKYIGVASPVPAQAMLLPSITNFQNGFSASAGSASQSSSPLFGHQAQSSYNSSGFQFSPSSNAPQSSSQPSMGFNFNQPSSSSFSFSPTYGAAQTTPQSSGFPFSPTFGAPQTTQQSSGFSFSPTNGAAQPMQQASGFSSVIAPQSASFGPSFGSSSTSGTSSSASNQTSGKRVRSLRRDLTPGSSSTIQPMIVDNSANIYNMNRIASSLSNAATTPISSNNQIPDFKNWRSSSNHSTASSSATSGTSSSAVASNSLNNGDNSWSLGITNITIKGISKIISIPFGGSNQAQGTSSNQPTTTTTVQPTKSQARLKGTNQGNKRLKNSKRSGTVKQDDLTSSQNITAMNILKKYINYVTNPPAKEDCCICFDSLKEASSYGSSDSHKVIKLAKCSHMFHLECIIAMYDNGSKNGSLQCPSCKVIYGVKYGCCPDGTMEWEVNSRHSLSGYEGCGVIKIDYNIFDGVQSFMHPNPGVRYKVRGFPRVGYLPDNIDGRKALSLLELAWKRRLTFTIGTSVTTGEQDVVVWNEIHHKTDMTNDRGHGYPDPNYLNNVMNELAAQGVVDEDDDDDS